MSTTDPLTTLRHELLEWLDDWWDPSISLLEWRRRLMSSQWGCATWPESEGGRGLDSSAAALITTTLEEYGVPTMPETVGAHLAVPTLLQHGSASLKTTYLVPTLVGEIVWCQLFSEPGAGSDLAGLSTRAERDGDEWVVNGQKVWTTGAAHADVGLLLARTNSTVPKHQGITYFVIPMQQDGITVRPLRQMNGHSSFNEVFLDNARVPDANILGHRERGWEVALTTLAHERRLTTSRRRNPVRDGDGRVWRELLAEQVAASEPHKWYPQRAGRVDLLVERARETGRATEGLVRQSVVDVTSRALIAKLTAQRAAATRRQGQPPGPEGSLGKLTTSNIARAASRAHSLIAGSSGMICGPDTPAHGLVAEVFVSVPGQSIAGGTDEIQHNIIGERVLGLPKEPSVDTTIPFRDITRSAR